MARAPEDILIESSNTTPLPLAQNPDSAQNQSDILAPLTQNYNVFDISPSSLASFGSNPTQNINTFDYYNTNAIPNENGKKSLAVAACLGFFIGAVIMFVVRSVARRRDGVLRTTRPLSNGNSGQVGARRPSFLRRKDALGFPGNGARTTARQASGEAMIDVDRDNGAGRLTAASPTHGGRVWRKVDEDSHSADSM